MASVVPTPPTTREADPPVSTTTPAHGRSVHPLAWWTWALGLAVAVSSTTNPLAIALLLVATIFVVLGRRDDSPWARAFGAYLVLGAVIIAARAAFYVLFGLKTGGTVLLDLPNVPLPAWAVGVNMLGPVQAPGLLSAAYGGLRLAALVICFGAANALANPKRALRSLPASLHHLGTAVVIAVTVSPQLVTSFGRVRRAQRLRGQDSKGPRSFFACLLPVLQDALDRSLALAASMDSRGYARSTPDRGDPWVTATLLVALLSGVMGTYGLLDGASPGWLGVPMLVVGAFVAVTASILAGRRVHRTRYRPDPWRLQETIVAASGAVVALVLVVTAGADAGALNPMLSSMSLPSVPPAVVVGALLAALPAVLSTGVRPGRSR